MAGYEDLELELSTLYESMQNKVRDYRTYLDHLQDIGNPHKIVKDYLDLSNIHNWPMSDNSALTMDDERSYLPVGGAYRMIEVRVKPLLDKHIADKTNPHNTTLDHINAYSAEEIDFMVLRKLKRTAIAYDTANVAGKTNANLYNETRTNLAVSDLAAGTFHATVLAHSLSRARFGQYARDFGRAGPTLINNSYLRISDHNGYWSKAGVPAGHPASYWTQQAAQSAVHYPIGSSNKLGVISTATSSYYSMAATPQSNSWATGSIGTIMAFRRIGAHNHMLVARVTAGAVVNVAITYCGVDVAGQPTERVLVEANIGYDVADRPAGWRGGSIRLHCLRLDDVFTLEFSPWNSSTLTQTLTVALPSYIDLQAIFNQPCSYGYYVHNQDLAAWLNTAMTEVDTEEFVLAGDSTWIHLKDALFQAGDRSGGIVVVPGNFGDDAGARNGISNHPAAPGDYLISNFHEYAGGNNVGIYGMTTVVGRRQPNGTTSWII